MRRDLNQFVMGLLLLTLAFARQGEAQQVSTLVSSINASGDVAVGPDGNIYVADFGNFLNNANGTRVYQITPQGQVSIFATGFAGASGNEFDAAGNLIQVNIGGNRVDQIDPGGNVTTIANAGLVNPVGVAIDSNGTIFVANCGNSSISRLQNGVGVTIATGSPLSCPNGLTIDPDGNLYTANFNNGNIVKITPNGQMSILATTPNSTFRPSGGNGHITYGNGRLYLVSNAASQAFELTLDGQLTVIAGDGTRGNTDGPLLQSSFSAPNGIALSADGRFLYVNTALSTLGTTLNSATFPLNPSAIRVIDLGASFTINPGLNGSWFDPETTGQGLLFDVVPSTQTFVAAWFTFEDDQASRSKIGASEHRWFTLLGPYDGDTATLDIFLTEGGIFDDPAMATSTIAGTATLTFESCTEASFDYFLDSGPQGSISLARITPDVLCADLAGAGR